MFSDSWHWPEFSQPHNYHNYHSWENDLYPGINYFPFVSDGTIPEQEAEQPESGSLEALLRVKKDEVEAKITAWQESEVAKINNRFKREESIIKGREEEKANKAKSLLNKVERKLDEKRLKADENMQNVVAKAHRKAEQRKASAEAKKGTKVEKVVQAANLMRTVGRPPVKRSFFCRMIDYLF